MIRNHLRAVFALSAIGVPLLRFIAPSWLSIMGVGPSWAVLWLLPWSLLDGPVSGVLAGCALGLILDAISLDPGTQVPVLVILGLWWGCLGKRGLQIERGLILGLLAWMGSVLVGLAFWLQFWLVQMPGDISVFHSWSLHTILSQAIVTGLLAPLLSSWLLFVFRDSRIIR